MRIKRTVTECPHTDKPHEGKGKCAACYSRDRYRERHPDCVSRDTPAIDRFDARVREEPNGCWSWTGGHKSRLQGSYPMFTPPGKSLPCHAVAWAYKHIRGLEPPKRGSGLELSHQPDRCKLMSSCCNPFHVEPETHEQNMRRIPEHKRKQLCANARKHIKNHKPKTHCLRGHARTPDNLTKDGQCKHCRQDKRNLASWVNAVSRAIGKAA